MSKPSTPSKAPSEDEVLRRMLATPPAPHKPKKVSAKKTPKRAK